METAAESLLDTVQPPPGGGGMFTLQRRSESKE